MKQTAGLESRRRLLWFAGKSVRAWGFLEASVVGVVILTIPLLMTTEVISRYGLRAVPGGIDEFILIIAAYCYFIGAAHASRRRNQITVTILDVINVRQRIKSYIDIIAAVLAFGVCAAFSYYAIVYNHWVVTQGLLVIPFRWSLVVWVVSLAIGMVLMSLYELLNLVRKVRAVC